jgi:hypothetical protein
VKSSSKYPCLPNRFLELISVLCGTPQLLDLDHASINTRDGAGKIDRSVPVVETAPTSGWRLSASVGRLWRGAP